MRDSAERYPDAAALLWRGKETSYSVLWQDIQRGASALHRYCHSRDLPFGTRVAVLALNGPEFVELLYAIPTAGHILVPINTRLAVPEWLFQLHHSGAAIVLGDSELLDRLKEHPEYPAELETIAFGQPYQAWIKKYHSTEDAHQQRPLNPHDDAWLLFTSGTTGKPKGAVLTHSSLAAALDSTAHGRPVRTDDRYLYPFPLFHVSAHNVLLQHRHGACVILMPAFDAAQMLRCIVEHGATTLSLAPTMIAMLLDHPNFRPADLANVRSIGYGASAIGGALLSRVLTETSVGLSQGYGMTELSGSIAFLGEDEHRDAAQCHVQRLKSVGKPVPGVDIKLIDGEIAVRSEQIMSRYWCDPEATANTLQDGWLLTGDMGHFDTDGYLYIVDRKKDMIISGGENIASREPEDILLLHPAIKQAAVVGIPHPKWGEAACAVVVLHESYRPTEEDLQTHCRQHLAGYKVPKAVLFVPSIHHNANGKIDKLALRKLAAQRLT